VPEPNIKIYLRFCKRKFAMFIVPHDFDIDKQGKKKRVSGATRIAM
jgi:hypothetical protein